MASLSENLFSLRKKENLTQEQVAEGTGIVLRSYRRYEMGEREPVASTLVRLADFYNVTIDYLVGRTGKMK